MGELKVGKLREEKVNKGVNEISLRKYESVVELWKSMKNAWLLPEKWPNEWMNMTKNVHKIIKIHTQYTANIENDPKIKKI